MTQPTAFKRNEASGLDLGWVNQIKVNRNAADRRAASLANRRTVKKEYQAAWLIRAVQCMDLTTLGGDDTPGRVERLCMKAMRPLRADLMQALGLESLQRFVQGEPLWRVHQLVFAVLALESEPVDPRL